MQTAMGAAVKARREIGIRGLASDYDVEAVAAWAGARVRTHPGIPDLPAHQIGRSIWLGDDLRGARRRYILGHELGHFCLGHGLSYYTVPLTLVGSALESDADLYAGILLLGFPNPDPESEFNHALAEAQHAGVPDDCLLRFFNAARPVVARLGLS